MSISRAFRYRCLLSAPMVLAAPLSAQPDTLSLPGHCTPVMTVQMRGCSVENIFYCEGEPEAQRHRLNLYDDGYAYLSTVSHEGQWLNSSGSDTPGHEMLQEPATDLIQITQLLANATDALDFTMRASDGAITRYIGTDSLTGETTEIDGMELLRGTFVLRAEDANGAEVFNSEGTQFVHAETQLFFPDTTIWSGGGESFEIISTPVAFIFQGEPGFLSAIPQYDCH